MTEPQSYADLLRELEPRVIYDEAENERALAIVDRLMSMRAKDSDPTLVAALERAIDLFATLISMFEDRAYPIKKPTPVERLAHRMEARNLSTRDVAVGVGMTTAELANILSGTRGITLEQGFKLAEFFSDPPAVFLGERTASLIEAARTRASELFGENASTRIEGEFFLVETILDVETADGLIRQLEDFWDKYDPQATAYVGLCHVHQLRR